MILPRTAGRRLWSKSEELNLSKCFPVYVCERTLLDEVGMSHTGPKPDLKFSYIGMFIDSTRSIAAVPDLHMSVLEKRESKSKSDRGIVRSRFLLRNQRRETVLESIANNLVARRERADPHNSDV
jgi:hypothetical protein